MMYNLLSIIFSVWDITLSIFKMKDNIEVSDIVYLYIIYIRENKINITKRMNRNPVI